MRAYRVEQQQWRRVEMEERPDESGDQLHVRLGFESHVYFRIGALDGFGFAVYMPRSPEGEPAAAGAAGAADETGDFCLVDALVGDRWWYIFCAELPDLVAVLNFVAPACRAVADAVAAEELFHHHAHLREGKFDWYCDHCLMERERSEG